MRRTHSQNSASLTHIPQASGYPFVGSLPAFLSSPLDTLFELYTRHGDVVAVNMAGHRFVLITNPDDVEHVLVNNHENYVKGYDKARALVGNGLIMNEGSSWRTQRRLMQPAFHHSRVGSLVETISGRVSTLIERWARLTDLGKPVDLVFEMSLLTQEIIAKTMFGKDTTAGERIGAAFDETLSGIEVRLAAPDWLTSLRVLANRRFGRALRVIDDEMRELITRRAGEEEPGDDLLGMLLQARDAETGRPMSYQQLRDEVTLIYLAGYETTAVSLVWTLYLLAQHPEWLDSLAEEAEQVLPESGVTADDINNLKRCRMVLDESLRMFPPAWQFTRRSTSEDVVGGYQIGRDITLWISPYVTQRRPDLWESSSEFMPERFVGNAQDKPLGYSYFPFGGGPRKCLGMNLALTEATLTLAQIARVFRLTPETDFRRIHPRPRATLKPSGPVLASILRR